MRNSPKTIVRMYRMNRLWGDNILEALYYALRGKAFTASYNGHLVDKEIYIELTQNHEINDDLDKLT